jgi:hypothetical protein
MNFRVLGGEGSRIENIFGRHSILFLPEIVSPQFVNKEKRGEIRFTFTDPILSEIEYIYFVHAHLDKERYFIIDWEIFSILMASLI